MPNFSDIFPTLRIDPKDVPGSWKRFLQKFNVAVRFEVCNRGMKKVVINDVEQDVNVFDDELKLCALLKAVSRSEEHTSELQSRERSRMPSSA